MDNKTNVNQNKKKKRKGNFVGNIIFLLTLIILIYLLMSVGLFANLVVNKNYPVNTYVNSKRYMYNMLENDEERALYVSLDDACKKIENSDKEYKSIPFVTYSKSISQKKAREIAWLFEYENPQYFWLNQEVSISYNYVFNQLSIGLLEDYQYGGPRRQAKNNIDAVAKDYLNNLNSFTNDYSKAKYIHDRLAIETKYLANDNDQSMVSALVYKQSVCAGYTKAFTYLCNLSGIETTTYLGVNHAWNACKIAGNWYNVDVTNDSGMSAGSDFFLKSDSEIDDIDKKLTTREKVSVTQDGQTSDYIYYLHDKDDISFPDFYEKWPACSKIYDGSSQNLSGSENIIEEYENEKKIGDLNGDGKISVSDIKGILSDSADTKVADVDGNGKVTVADAFIIVVYSTKALKNDDLFRIIGQEQATDIHVTG